MADEKKVKLKTSADQGKTQLNKFAIIGIIIVGIIIFAAVQSIPEKKEKPKPVKRTEISSDTIEEQSWAVRAQAEVREAQQNLREAERRNDALQKRLENMAKSQGSNDVQMRELLQRLEKLEKEPKVKEVPVPVYDKSGKGADGSPLAGIPVPIDQEGRPSGAVAPPRPWNKTDETAVRQGGMRTRQPAPKQADTPLIVTSDPSLEVSALDEAEAKVEYRKNRYAGFLPAGSFAKGVLLTGVDAGASEYTRGNPQPVLIRVSNDATMAGDQPFAMRTCFIMGNSYGDLSSERAYIRLSRLTCTDSRKKLVLETTIRGYAVDSDGTQGLRGKVVRRNGQLIAKALLAGLAQGISDAASTVSTNAASSVIGSTVAGGLSQQSTEIDSGRLAETAGFQGIGNATQILAEMYLDEAKNIFPVIFVPAGRVVTVVISEGAGLEWQSHEGLWQKKITPES